MSGTITSPVFAQPGSIEITNGVFDPSSLFDEVEAIKGLSTQSVRPSSHTFSPMTLRILTPETAELTRTLVELTEQAYKRKISSYLASYVLCGSGVWFPPHIDELPLTRLTLELSEEVSVEQYAPGDHIPGDFIEVPGDPVRTDSFKPGGVMSINNMCEPAQRAPHATQTSTDIQQPRAALVITMHN
jgi:hypothetical protein